MWWLTTAMAADPWIILALEQPIVHGKPVDVVQQQLATSQDIISFEPVFPGKLPDDETGRRMGSMYRARFAHPVEEAMAVNRVEAWRQTRGVRSAYRDSVGYGGGEPIIPNDSDFSEQWGLSNDGSFVSDAVIGADVSALDAWEYTTGSPDVVIAILDSGLSVDHPELENRVWQNINEIPNNGIDDDENTYIDDVYGWNFVSNNNDLTDDWGHGMNLAGIIAAAGNNSSLITGLCPNCTVMSLKNLDGDGAGWLSVWATSLKYAVDYGATIVSMSEGGSSNVEALDLAVQYAQEHGVLVVACMMNTNNDTSYYPAAYDGVVSVGATQWDDTRANPFTWGGGSNFGNHIDLIAPGNLIAGLSQNSTDISYWSGTSQAAPMVSATAGLIWSIEPSFTPEQVIQLLIAGAEDQVGNPEEDLEGWDPYYGYGRLNTAASLQELVGDEDGDGYGDSDCEPNDPAIYPGAVEVPDDGIDQDCSGKDTITCFEDNDGDGLGTTPILAEEGCTDYATEDGDCDDSDPDHTLNCTETKEDSPEKAGCGCNMSTTSIHTWFGLLAWVWMRRRA